jgi:broad-specificity NMP kinase
VFNVCPECGAWGVERVIEGTGDGVASVAICETCGARIAFARRPLFVVTGASGTGKTTVCRELMRRETGFVTLESDILWGSIDAADDAGLDGYWNAWLRLVKNINQAGRPVILCGTVLPERLERQPERRYVGDIHYLALVADPEDLARRLRARPAWRESGRTDFIEQHIAFNRWLVDHAEAAVASWSLLDTTGDTVAKSAARVLSWIERVLRNPV